jgi:hypothetical protein
MLGASIMAAQQPIISLFFASFSLAHVIIISDDVI